MRYLLPVVFVVGCCVSVSVGLCVTGSPWCLFGLLFAGLARIPERSTIELPADANGDVATMQDFVNFLRTGSGAAWWEAARNRRPDGPGKDGEDVGT